MGFEARALLKNTGGLHCVVESGKTSFGFLGVSDFFSFSFESVLK